MENLSYIFRAGRKALSPILLLLALFTCNYAFSHPGSVIPDTIASDEDIEDAWYYTIKASDGKGGDIDPEGDVIVWRGGSVTFEMDPDRGKEVDDVEVDGQSVGAVTTYTFSNVNANHTIRATFRTETFTITASAGPGGSISPAGSVEVKKDDKEEFQITADADYDILDVIVDGESKGAIKSYTFSKVKADHTISATFISKNYTITASAGSGGSISPSGAVVVKRGDDQTFSISPNTGYDISDVVVDGDSKGAVSSYRFSNVVSDHTISATFIPKNFTITSSAGTGGSISPAGAVVVKGGDDQTFSISPNNGYKISDVVVDGDSKGAVSTYRFSNVLSNHTINASFQTTVGVLSVSIPNEGMKIGDVVPVTLTVNDDQGTTYAFVSGSVGGYALEGFERLSATTYGAVFRIVEGGRSYTASQDIPVDNLVISKGSVLSAPYNKSIVQNGDPLDAELPVITSMEVETGTRKVGDVLELNILADGSGYTLHPTSSINGIAVTESNISFAELNGDNYILSYTVREGDNDVGAGNSELNASIVLEKPSGNVGLPYSTINNASQLIIDAHSPVVLKMEVPSLEVGVGGTVVVKLTADGLEYLPGAGTTVNGVPFSSPRVTFTELSVGLYELSYLVGIDDPGVDPGELQVHVVMSDLAGNLSEPYVILDPNSLEIYTELPNATFGEVQPICEGEEAEISILLSGRAPWSFDVNDGLTTTSFVDISSSNYRMTIAPEQNTSYQISLVKDVNGVENTHTADALVTVIENPEVEILNLATGYNVEADPVELEANVPGGIFTGPGVVSATGYFYPALADTIDSPHQITYTYENSNGCLSETSKLVYVLGSQGAVLIPDNTVCSGDIPFTASVLNVPAAEGSYKLLNSDSQETEGLTDHGDNTATINPAMLESDYYTIIYQYYDQAILFLRESFTVESAIQPQILNLTEDSYCQNAAPIELQSDLDDAIFQGQGVSENLDGGYTFYPDAAAPGLVTITCSSYSENGCSASTEQDVNILFTPAVQFELSTECIPEGGENVSFINQTDDRPSIESWSWNFGDEGSGEDNISDLPSPSHQYQQPGAKSISLTATTYEGCVSQYVLETIIDSKPVVDFTWVSDCFTDGSAVNFVNRSSHGSALVDSIIWTFKTSDGVVLGEVLSKTASDTVQFPFYEARDYQVDLYTRTSGGCSNEITKVISLSPTIPLSSEGFIESFDQTVGQWTIQSDNQVESWIWGVPHFNGYIPTGGENAWFTMFPIDNGSYIENSWIQSPCFDFTAMERPLIRMEVMRSFAPGKGGAVLQYKDQGEGVWKTIGENSPGIGWYNAENLSNKPGGSSKGWSLDEFVPDTEWKTVVHDLDQVAGKANIAFRIAIATHGRQPIGNQGFAVNNMMVAERSKLSVLEHFTSNTSDTSRLADDVIDAFASTHSRDVIDLQYHMDMGGMDPMHQNNPLSSSTRSFNYGVPVVPYTVLDGGVESSHHRYDFSELSKGPVADHLRLTTLETPAFDIELSVDWMESGLEAHTLITCTADRYDNFVQLYLVVLETSVTAYTGRNGDTDFRNVVVDMLPTPTGRLLGDNWREGRSENLSDSWGYKPYVEDIDELAVVAFLQDRTTGQIIDAAVKYKDPTVGIMNPASEIRGLNVYPNPARSYLYVNLGTSTEQSGRIELLDVNGRIVLQQQVPAGYQLIQLDIDQMNPGVYFLRWIESEKTMGTSKLIKAR